MAALLESGSLLLLLENTSAASSARQRFQLNPLSGNEFCHVGMKSFTRAAFLNSRIQKVFQKNLTDWLFYTPPSHADGLEAYAAPVGHIMHLSGIPIYLNDSTYDGSTEHG